MDVALGVSMTPTTVRLVLVEGGNADGDIVDQHDFDTTINVDAQTITALDQVISAILGTREDAAEGGYQVTSTAVTWADPAQAAALREELAASEREMGRLMGAEGGWVLAAESSLSATSFSSFPAIWCSRSSASAGGFPP